MKKYIALILSLLMLVPVTVPVRALEGTANFTRSRKYENNFKDVAADDWFYKNVAAAYEYGIIDGRSEVSFEPDGNITLAETVKLAAVLHSAYHGNGTALANAADGQWYDNYVKYAQDAGIIGNIIKNGDEMNASANRLTVAKLLYNAFPESEYAAVNAVWDGLIPDVSTNSAPEVYALYAAGITVGRDETLAFDPEASITRAEIAAIVTRMADRSLRLTFTANAVASVQMPSLMGLNNYTLSAAYSDSFFDSGSYAENGGIAKFAITLASAAYGNNVTGADVRMKELLSGIGYEVLVQNNYDSYTAKDEKSDFSAYTIARKTIYRDGEEFYAYLLVVRGTFDIAEWYSNFDVGQGENEREHNGFFAAADEILPVLKAAMDTEASKNILLTTGHSRGAAISSVIAKKLTDSADIAYAENIYSYNFGCPSVTLDTEDSASGKYDNIRCYNISGDIIVRAPYNHWGYRVAGTEIILSNSGEDFTAASAAYKEMTGAPYLGLDSVAAAQSILDEWCPTKADFYKKDATGTSPYKVITQLIALGSGDITPGQLMAQFGTFRLSMQGLALIQYFTLNSIPIFNAHSFEAYYCRINAMYK